MKFDTQKDGVTEVWILHCTNKKSRQKKIQKKNRIKMGQCYYADAYSVSLAGPV